MNIDTRTLKTRIREEYARLTARENELRKELEELGSEKLRLQEWESSVEDFENLLSEIEDKIEIDSPHSFEVIPSLKEETDGPAPQSVVSFEGFNPVPEEGQQSRAPEHSVTTHSSHVVNHWG
ncbi:MAG TPA: hypothetical protein VKZ59_10110 [Acidobacteriota bacterium]|nr:hypothetical protein [Acidobacteriota bacterium]